VPPSSCHECERKWPALHSTPVGEGIPVTTRQQVHCLLVFKCYCPPCVFFSFFCNISNSVFLYLNFTLFLQHFALCAFFSFIFLSTLPLSSLISSANISCSKHQPLFNPSFLTDNNIIPFTCCSPLLLLLSAIPHILSYFPFTEQSLHICPLTPLPVCCQPLMQHCHQLGPREAGRHTLPPVWYSDFLPQTAVNRHWHSTRDWLCNTCVFFLTM